VRRALDEDRAFEDITTRATVPEAAKGRARLIARDGCVIAGTDVLAATFLEIDASLSISFNVRDGERARAGQTIATIEGSLRSILSAERTALNFMQRLSGEATLTRRFLDAAGPRVEIRDTRKTTPGLRGLEKAAVRAAGGTNHRATLADAVLIKDNHIAAAGGVQAAVKAAKPLEVPIEVECETLDDVRAAIAAGADEVLLDNMDVETMTRAVEMAKAAGRRTEASGGITLETAGRIAKTGVDSISVGALTHSAPAVDLSLEIEQVE
jgi:nicotinate-nucleotide pyrophosphorylase (carboxylating)